MNDPFKDNYRKSDCGKHNKSSVTDVANLNCAGLDVFRGGLSNAVQSSRVLAKFTQAYPFSLWNAVCEIQGFKIAIDGAG